MKKTISIALSIAFLIPSLAFADSTVIATAGTGATINPSGTTVVATGDTQVFNFGADQGYHLTNVAFDGIGQGVISSLDFVGDLADHTISAFAGINASTGGTQPFCSSPMAPGWNVAMIGGGCGSTQLYVPFGAAFYDGSICSFNGGCIVK